MKAWSFKVANVYGTEVRIHATFLLLIAWMGWVSYAHGGSDAAVNNLAFLCLMFFCVLLHEFGHVMAARHYGIKTPDITLWPIGGVARLERMPREPVQEFIVAICGPLVNVAIAALLFVVVGWPKQSFDFTTGSLVVSLMQWNIIMVLFNMVPAFPMDGGRVLRSLLAMAMDYNRATRLAATIGQFLAVVVFMWMLFNPSNPMLMIIAVFVFLSAGQEAAMVSSEEATRGLRVRDAMLTDFHTLSLSATLREAVTLLLAGTQHDFPVVNGQGAFQGLLTRTALIGALADHGALHSVAVAMTPCEIPLDPAEDLSEGLQALRISKWPALPVIEPQSGRLVGLLTAENVGELLMVRSVLTHTRPS